MTTIPVNGPHDAGRAARQVEPASLLGGPNIPAALPIREEAIGASGWTRALALVAAAFLAITGVYFGVSTVHDMATRHAPASHSYTCHQTDPSGTDVNAAGVPVVHGRMWVCP